MIHKIVISRVVWRIVLIFLYRFFQPICSFGLHMRIANAFLFFFFISLDVPGLLLEQKLRVIPTLATVDNGLEIKCGIKGSSEIIWRRNNVDLHKIHNPEITVFDDGSLYISSVGIHHMGNYTCHDKEDPSIKQTHILKVHMPPKVSVSPTTQLHKSNSDVILKCHAEGIPRPELSWEVNEMPLPNNLRHYIRQHENGTLVIHNANYLTDTGAYKCMAQNQAGKAQDVSTVFIQNPNTSQSMVTTNRFHESFMVFHEDGYIVYEPTECAIRREVKKDYGNFKYIPEALDGPLSLCEPTHPCSWGSTVNVKNKFIYISQPRENRVVVVEITRRWNPVQVINTDKDPVSLHYIENLDQVWVLCWNSEEDTGSKTIVVIRDASKDQQHHAVHTQPIGNRFDLVKKMFLPPTNTLHPTFRFGYVMHSGQRGLFKLDIEGMKYMKNIDLNQYKCEPENLAFIPLVPLSIQLIKQGEHCPVGKILDIHISSVGRFFTFLGDLIIIICLFPLARSPFLLFPPSPLLFFPPLFPPSPFLPPPPRLFPPPSRLSFSSSAPFLPPPSLAPLRLPPPPSFPPLSPALLFFLRPLVFFPPLACSPFLPPPPVFPPSLALLFFLRPPLFPPLSPALLFFLNLFLNCGHIVIQCLANEENGMQSLQLILDYITDKVIANSTTAGIPYVSPDSQHMVNVNKHDGLLTVTKITEDGKFGYSFTLTTNGPIDDISFFHSSRKSGYDLYLTSAKRNDVIYVNLETGKMEIIENVGHNSEEKSWPWLESQWPIISGNVFSDFPPLSYCLFIFILSLSDNFFISLFHPYSSPSAFFH
ncbi:FSTL5 [Acanthosepion pharaonis]|uniref:FSTL5 n=1 Tax=Acanthosepion pharaonis TaxID=158019 RepID=A0A812BDL3_ACAPH|nr:FSTL5 [Sepia pharaonis]